MRTLNELFLLCRSESLTIADLSRLTGIQYDRAYRLTRAEKLSHVMTVKELHQITDAFPTFLINY